MILIKKNFLAIILILIIVEKKDIGFCLRIPNFLSFFNSDVHNSNNSLTQENSTFFHTENEIKLSNKFKIPKKNFCSKDHGLGINLFVMVVSSPNNFEARNAIRQTWGGFRIRNDSKLLFVIGQSSILEMNKKIIKEDKKYDDILQGQYQDAYYNLTLKSLSIINWINDNCEKAKYVLKVDDDMFVNMQNLVEFTRKNDLKNSIIGRISKKTLPIRKSSSKWYVPEFAYSEKYYPSYTTGPAYLIHREVIPKLLKIINSNSTQVLKIEDVFLTGIIAEKANVKRVNNKLFRNDRIAVRKKNFDSFFSLHRYKPKEILRIWKNVH